MLSSYGFVANRTHSIVSHSIMFAYTVCQIKQTVYRTTHKIPFFFFFLLKEMNAFI